jgi:hypothetical protein
MPKRKSGPAVQCGARLRASGSGCARFVARATAITGARQRPRPSGVRLHAIQLKTAVAVTSVRTDFVDAAPQRPEQPPLLANPRSTSLRGRAAMRRAARADSVLIGKIESLTWHLPPGQKLRLLQSARGLELRPIPAAAAFSHRSREALVP